MKHSILGLLFFAMLMITSCKSDKKEAETVVDEPTQTEEATENSRQPTEVKDEPAYYSEKRKVTLALESKSDSNVTGNVLFTQDQGVVTMIARLKGLSPGEHAIHIHEKADCSSADGKSSGGHWNPTGQPHGKWGEATGYHKGDIGNFIANNEGNGNITKITDEWCIGCGDETKDILGKAIIVHQGTDDFTSQPSGAAGARVSCGGIIE
ncbi:superoxide dismutase family protein [uncultured Psychroserpens sp.]|uniref:superoxide dismutase family protein n=1 Tax=uncultured Psychroserpens sp. TaxID=255436 RepID=UPI0026248C9E|nr:superoxide dismutase family protein [uncultured Psychroserpens sp.]